VRKIFLLIGGFVAIPALVIASLIGVAAFGGSNAAALDTCIPASVGIGGQMTIKGKPITAEQRKNAQTVIGVGKTRGFSRRDVKIALMTSIQESSILSLPYGDRDSLGIFQQRPSQGWGTPSQVTDPIYASNRFYDALADVKNRDQMSLLDVALAVQKPSREAYESSRNRFMDWEAEAEALLGNTEFKAGEATPELENCTYGVITGTSSDPGPGPQNPKTGLVPRAENLRTVILNTWGCVKLRQQPCVSEIGGFSVRDSGPQDHTLGLALDVTISDRISLTPREPQTALGWQIACTLQKSATQLGVRYQIWQGMIWNITRPTEGGSGRCGPVTGWRPYCSEYYGNGRLVCGADLGVVAGHYDHVPHHRAARGRGLAMHSSFYPIFLP
jgi:hypothetical protein